ncbi:MAG TPA: carbamoyltransferase HypF [Candidatus Aquilonibacter sp.]|nr:carbamoyltransferase HypF [Candidatus Aquilonibacter sp.]
MQVRKEIRISGIVQGVGFRPYIYRLATDRNLAGSVSNTSSGVTIEVQGSDELVADFLSHLPGGAPALAQITRLIVREIPCEPERPFEIRPSHTGERASALISPDVAVCDDCLRELFDPRDRRHLYPFINCTNCGPRFTIVRDIPYDRPRTSMSLFPMCENCRAEFEDPRDRRFHAQPNACWKCGPQVQLWDAQGRALESVDPITAAAKKLHAGEIVAMKGLGGFHLAVDATNSDAVQRLRRRKHRFEKPFAVMLPDLESAARSCHIDSDAEKLLGMRQRPIVLLPKLPGGAIADFVAPHQNDLGIFLPYTPMHHLLFAAGKFAGLVMTSGNLSEEPIAIDNREAVERLGEIADCFLVHDRQILVRCDDSVMCVSSGTPRQIRRSRGYVPAPVRLHKELPQILAVGGELKNTICLTRGSEAFLSQHIGDLENSAAFDFFREAIEHLSAILEVKPAVIAHDLHPDYLSTKWAVAQKGVRRIGVQHHHAHVAACMAENHLDGRVIGFSFDGTGYGTDGNIWGGEVLIADYERFVRAAHLAYVPLPGGAAAIREPWRMAVSYLLDAIGEGALRVEIPFTRAIDRRKGQMIAKMIAQRINSPLTSSCGRLFDAIAALIGVRHSASYEGQAAVELEMRARRSNDTRAYPFDLYRKGGLCQIGSRPLIRSIVEDLGRGISVETIGRRFHNGLVETLAVLSQRLREETGLNRVCLSGGTFQNELLLGGLTAKLRDASFKVYAPSQVPSGDGGLSLGQAAVAAFHMPPDCE